MKITHITAMLAAAAVVTALLAGCTATAPQPSPTATKTAQAIPGLPKGVTPATNIPADVPNDAKARQSVELNGCKRIAGGWEATGIARNPGKSPATYTITVFFTTSTATVINTAQTKVTVKPGGTTNWTAAQKFTAPQKTLCVLRGVA